jgi:hypothetical protein
MSPPRDFCEFLRELPDFVPNDSILCLEGGDAPDLEAYLASRPAVYDNETDQGFFKLRPKTFYMPITKMNLLGFADLCERHAEPEVCNTLSVYWTNHMILSWHDLPDDPIYLSDKLDETVLRSVCNTLGCESLAYAATEKDLIKDNALRC